MRISFGNLRDLGAIAWQYSLMKFRRVRDESLLHSQSSPRYPCIDSKAEKWRECHALPHLLPDAIAKHYSPPHRQPPQLSINYAQVHI